MKIAILIIFVAILFLVPFIIKNKKVFLLYFILISIFDANVLFENIYYNYTHPIGDRYIFEGLGLVISTLIASILSVGIVAKMILNLIFAKNYKETFLYYILKIGYKVKYYILSIIVLIPIVFQLYLLSSALNAYNHAKDMKAIDIQDKSALDFYSPTIQHIKISAGMPPRQYRWSYHRKKYVFEEYQRKTYILDSNKSNNFEFYFYRHYKDYLLSIPKKFNPSIKDNIIHFEMTNEADTGKYFDKEHNIINAQLPYHHFSFRGDTIEKYKDKYRLKREKIKMKKYDSKQRKYISNEYLRYYLKDKLIIDCKIDELNIASDYCKMQLFDKQFYCECLIHKKNINKWDEIQKKLPKLFKSFIKDIKEYQIDDIFYPGSIFGTNYYYTS